MLNTVYRYKFIVTLALCLIIILSTFQTFLTLYFGVYVDYNFITNLLVVLLPILLTHLFGMFDGAQTVRKDAPEQSKFWTNKLTMTDYTMESSVYSPAEKWFIGGNYKFPPGNPFKCDFWHWCKWMWTLCISATVTTAVMAALILPREWGYGLLSYVFLYAVEGFTFTFYYSFAFRKDRTWQWYWNHITHPEW